MNADRREMLALGLVTGIFASVGMLGLLASIAQAVAR